jgi:metal-responsive CopG/Arc/MetJ family transcriptional regulator
MSPEPTDRPTSRLYKGIRRIDVTLPAVLVAELDRDISELGYFVTRSSIIEVAIQRSS